LIAVYLKVNAMNLAEFVTATKRPILLDGSMGTQLAVAGVEMGGPANLSHPEAVSAIHRKYAEIGVDFIITNTLTMNRIFIDSHHLKIDTREVNLTGAKLARSVVHEGQFVLGDISSTGKLLQPSGPLTEKEAYAAYVEQAAILAEGGVDGFIIETMIDLKEALCALRGCKTTGLPVIASMSFETMRGGGRTVMGDSARDCARKLAEEKPLALGTNCGGLTPLEMAEITAIMAQETTIPIIAQPNAGLPRFAAGQTLFDMTPQDFAAGVLACVDKGARLVGGCCGTSPAHIKALFDLLHDRRR
jgi:5-methyltetrahydrofolate--homocysteine methyltransferase